MKQYKYFKISIENQICWLRINRPNKNNAVNQEVLSELDQCLDEIRSEKDIRVLVIGSTINEAFSAGADISFFYEMDEESGVHLSHELHRIYGSLEKMPIPVIAAVKGYCITAGLELSLCCDIIYAAENAQFSQIEVKWGMTPGAGGTQRLARAIGIYRAKEFSFTAELIDAQKALELGLVNAVYPLDDLEEKVSILCQKIIKNSPRAIAKTKELVNEAIYTSTAAFHHEADVFGSNFGTGEPQERFTRFFERKRKTDINL